MNNVHFCSDTKSAHTLNSSMQQGDQLRGLIASLPQVKMPASKHSMLLAHLGIVARCMIVQHYSDVAMTPVSLKTCK